MANAAVFGKAYPGTVFLDLESKVHFDLTVVFDDTPPAEFDYTVKLKDFMGNVWKTWTGSALTNGNLKTVVSIPAWDGMINGEKIPFMPYRWYSTVEWNEGQEQKKAHYAHCKGQDMAGGDGNNRNNVVSNDDVDGVSATNTMSAVDIYFPAAGIPLVVERYANSASGQDDPGHAVFDEWMFNWQEYVLFDPSDGAQGSYTVVFMDRSRVRFAWNATGQAWLPSVDYHKKYSFDPNGSGSTWILTFANGWKHTYNNSGKLIKIEDTKGHYISYNWLNNNVRLESIVHVNGRTLNFTYSEIDDEHFQMKIMPYGISREYRYLIRYDTNSIVKYTDPGGAETAYRNQDDYYTNFDGVKALTLPNGYLFKNESQGGSPVARKVGGQTNAEGSTMSYDFNYETGETSAVHGDREWSYGSDPATGLMESKSDKYNNEWSLQYSDTRFRTPTDVTDPENNQTQYEYDSLGNVTSVTDALGNEWQFEYGNQYFKTKVTKITYPSPFNYEEIFEYDNTTGNITRHVSPAELKPHISITPAGLKTGFSGG